MLHISRPAHGILICLLLFTPCACDRNAHVAEMADENASAMPVTVDDVLSRCGQTYARLKTLRVAGGMVDARRDERRQAPMRIELARPGQCRAQVDMDVAVVDGDAWWTYRAGADGFRAHKSFTKTPIETAVSLMSDGALSLVPSLFIRGEDALERDATGRFVGWRLVGAGWSAGRPCYTLEQRASAKTGGAKLRLYIDQDSWLVRRWVLMARRPGGRDAAVLDVTCHELAPEAELPEDAFGRRLPTRIELPDAHHAAAM